MGALGGLPSGETVSATALRVLLILGVATACGRPSGEVGIEASGPQPSMEWTMACTGAGAGYTVHYPATWFTVDDGPVPCRFFHPEPFVLPEKSEATGVAVTVQLAPVPFDEIVSRLDGTGAFDEVLSRQPVDVSGRRALRIETRTRGAGLLPAGIGRVTWYVEAGGETLVATTSAIASAGTFLANTGVLDDIVATAEIGQDLSTMPGATEEARQAIAVT